VAISAIDSLSIRISVSITMSASLEMTAVRGSLLA